MQVEKGRIAYRPAIIDDISALVDCRVQFLNEHFQHPEDEDSAAVRKSLREYFLRTIPSGEFVAWVAEYDGRIIVTSGMVVWDKPAKYGGVESGKLGYLLNSYTVPEARRRGIGTRLLDELINEARSLWLKYLHLHATKDGINMYRRAGFTELEYPELELRLGS